MALLSKTEIQFLQGHKSTISKSHEYKLKSVIKKKVCNLVAKELPLLIKLFPDMDLTKFSNTNKNFYSDVEGLTKISKDSYNSNKLQNKKINYKDKFCCNNNSPAQI